MKPKAQKWIKRIILVFVLCLGIGGFVAWEYHYQPSNTTTNYKKAETSSIGSKATIDDIKCESMEGTAEHVHIYLSIIDNGHQIVIPEGIGIDTQRNCFYWLHTHSSTGIIHVESPVKRIFTLGNFFDIWGEPLNKGQIGPHSNGSEIRAYVDGELFTGNPRSITLTSHKRILIQIGPHFVPLPPPFQFPKGL